MDGLVYRAGSVDGMEEVRVRVLSSIFAQGADLLPPPFKIMFRQDSVTR
jgi:hypothetical protein